MGHCSFATGFVLAWKVIRSCFKRSLSFSVFPLLFNHYCSYPLLLTYKKSPDVPLEWDTNQLVSRSREDIVGQDSVVPRHITVLLGALIVGFVVADSNEELNEAVRWERKQRNDIELKVRIKTGWYWLFFCGMFYFPRFGTVGWVIFVSERLNPPNRTIQYQQRYCNIILGYDEGDTSYPNSVAQ